MAPAIRVRCLTTGLVRPTVATRGVRRYVFRRWSPTAAPVHAFLVEHPQGVLLFDTGQSARATRPGYHHRWHPFFRLSRFELRPEDEAAAQLVRLGLRPDDVRWIVISHLHTDHVGDIGRFPHAEVFVSRPEWDRAAGIRGKVRGYIPQHWPRGLIPRLIDLEGPPIGPFASSHDIAGDGRLVIVPTPGHTPGHTALLVRGERAFLLGGDLSHSSQELERAAPTVAAWCRENGIVYLAAHDPHAPLLADGRP